MLLLVACAASPTEEPVVPADALASVNPFVGTGGPGFQVGSMTPAATRPFGMVRLGPDTGNETGVFEAYHCAGYHYDDAWIEGFSHLHMPGVGVADQGTILVMPVPAWEARFTASMEHRTPFSHDEEAAGAGWYRVVLDNDIEVELATTPHVGHHRYRFPPGSTPTLIFNLSHNLDGQNAGGEIHVDREAGTVEGWVINTGSFSGAGYTVWFYAEVDGTLTGGGTWADGSFGETDAAGVDVGAWLELAESEVSLRVGVSVVDAEGARANLAAEMPEPQALEDSIAASEAAWVEALSPFSVYGGDETDQRIFYTAVYHLLQLPTLYQDADGRFRGFDDQVHPDPGFAWHSDLSLWDTYRTAHPAYALFYPEKAADFANSLVSMAALGGAYPRWPVVKFDGSSMIGAPADIVLADSWVRGVTDWDIVAGFPMLWSQSRNQGEIPYNARAGYDSIERLGYIPVEEMGTSVGWLMELGWADGALGELSAALGRTADADFYRRRAQTYRNVYDPAVGFFHARHADGSFSDDFDADSWLDEYAEGTAWQYLVLAPQDPEGLAELLGGEAAAVARLDEMFAMTEEEGVGPAPNTGYWHGNEPDLHAAWLYALWGRPDKTVEWVRWIQANAYFDDPVGLAGNDDGGTLSAWYIFAAAGFYPIAGFPYYTLGIPTFPELRVRIGDHELRVIREGEGERVAAIWVDGREWTEPTIRHGVLAEARELRFVLE